MPDRVNWGKLVYGPFGQINTHRGKHLISTQNRKEGNEYVSKAKK